MNIKYILIGDGKEFGIAAIDTKTNITVMSIHKISVDCEFVKKLIGKFNKLKLSVIHFKDAVDDSLV